MSAGEIAYMRVPGGRLHDRCSATHLVSSVCRTKGLPSGSIDGRAVFDLLAKGDPAAAEEVTALVTALADAITNVVAVVNPECIVLGGGIMAQESALRPLLEAALRDRLPPRVYEVTKIAFAATGNDAGMLGALVHFLQEHGWDI